jgi:tetratricopeptide (TPR) repeat protein
MAYLNTGKYTEAIDYLLQIGRYFSGLAKGNGDALQNQPEEALKNYVKAVETNKNDLLHVVEQGKQLWQKKRMH